MSFLGEPTYDWTESQKGNWVCHVNGGREAEAVVFQNRGCEGWSIIINGAPHSRLVVNEYFYEVEDAYERAEAILEGAEADTKPVTGKRWEGSPTHWQQQKKRVLGQATYGRDYGYVKASVRSANSGKWYWLPYGSTGSNKPHGWFDTAEDAMRDADDNLE